MKTMFEATKEFHDAWVNLFWEVAKALRLQQLCQFISSTIRRIKR